MQAPKGTLCSINYSIQTDDSLEVKLSTYNLSMASVTVYDFDFYTELFPFNSLLEVAQKIEAWTNLWSKASPFSAFTIVNKESKFQGFAELVQGRDPNVVRIFFLFKSVEWQKEFGIEVVSNLVYYLKYLEDTKLLNGITVNKLTSIIDNEDLIANRIFRELTFQEAQSTEPKGKIWNHYSLNIS